MVRLVSQCETCGKRFVTDKSNVVHCRHCVLAVSVAAPALVRRSTEAVRPVVPLPQDPLVAPTPCKITSNACIDGELEHTTTAGNDGQRSNTDESDSSSLRMEPSPNKYQAHASVKESKELDDKPQPQLQSQPLVLDLVASEDEDDDLEFDVPLCSLQTDHASKPNADDATKSSECVIDLMSDDDVSEVDDMDEPILIDFQPDHPRLEEKEDDIDSFSDQDSFVDEQNDLHTASLRPIENVTTRENTNQNLATCLVCGADLMSLQAGYKGRLNHIKRCSKKHGVTAKDVRLDDAYELFTDPNNPPVTVSEINPYLRQNRWHGTETDVTASVSTVAPLPLQESARVLVRPPARSAHDLLMAGARKAATQPSPASGAARSVNDVLMAGARNRAKMAQVQPAEQSQKGGKRPRYNSTFRSYSNKTPCPKYKQIPSTDFVVDGFQYASSAATKNYFLSHFHADHYGGITKRWSEGIIYCSVSTANLVHQQLGVDRRFLHPLPMMTRTVIECANGRPVTVSLLPANHCPGAVMFLFDVSTRVILHVGDFRWNYDIMSSLALLQPFCRAPWAGIQSSSECRIDDLFLDTTYCDARYSLPTQNECIQAVVAMAVQEVKNAKAAKRRLLMLFGAYTIGKEAVYMSVARKLGLRVYVDKRRHQILSALEWSKEDLALLTTTPEETFLWVVPLGHVNMKKLVSYQSIRTPKFSRDYDSVIGFRPTGWSLTSKKNQDGLLGTATKGNLTVHSVPYSEHSSFPELVECLECLNPKRIVPTVNVSKSQQQLDLLMEHWRMEQSKHL